MKKPTSKITQVSSTDKFFVFLCEDGSVWQYCPEGEVWQCIAKDPKYKINNKE